VFFSPPEPKADAEAAAAGAVAAPAGGLASTAQEVALMLGPELARLSAASEEAAAAMLAQQNSIVRLSPMHLSWALLADRLNCRNRHVALCRGAIDLLCTLNGCNSEHAGASCARSGGGLSNR
jgi:hypothetical protein